MKRLLACLFIGLFFSFAAEAQNLYFVYLKNKQNNTFSLDAPGKFLSQRALDRRTKQKISLSERDLPVSPAYLEQITGTGAKVRYSSRWFNAVLIDTDPVILDKVKALSFVEKADKQMILPKENRLPAAEPSSERTEEDYGESFWQLAMLGIDKYHEAGKRGEGMLIAVLDNGFRNADLNPGMTGLQVLDNYDFTNSKNSVYNGGTHGADVLSVLAGNSPGKVIGGAYKASYLLYKSEIDNTKDTRVEEVYWALAAERADSAGADIISTSLGYVDFVDFTYTRENLDGKTAICTRAAEIAADLGMVVVKSSGNEGNSSWEKVTFPGDAPSVLTVAAVDENRLYANFSSRGPVAYKAVKPDVAALGQGVKMLSSSGFLNSNRGTSFAAPLIASLSACFWQTHPELTARQVTDFIRRAGDRYRTPNDSVGYGVPHFDRLELLITGTENDLEQKNSFSVYPNPSPNGKFFVRFSGTAQTSDWKLTDVLGRTLAAGRREFTNTSVFELPASVLPDQLYFLEISGPAGRQVFKLTSGF